MMLGSQRAMLGDDVASASFAVRDVAPDALLVSNIGLAQLSDELVGELVDARSRVGAHALAPLRLARIWEQTRPWEASARGRAVALHLLDQRAAGGAVVLVGVVALLEAAGHVVGRLVVLLDQLGDLALVAAAAISRSVVGTHTPSTSAVCSSRASTALGEGAVGT